MNILLKLFSASVAIVVMSAILTGCGEEREDNVPAVKLTASAIVSEISNGHGHNVEIPFTDISSSPADLLQYRSSDNTGHSHVIALSKQQMIDLNNGMRLTVTSSVQSPNTGTPHSHIWVIQGGNVLYDKFCYNCHTNDKRGHDPMNVSFNAGQAGAVRSPTAAALSTSPAAIPDALFTPSTSVSLDGPALYSAECSSCHGTLAASTKSNKTFAQIKAAISANSSMSALGSLTDAQLQAIAAALVK